MKVLMKITLVLLSVITILIGCDKKDSAFRGEYFKDHEIEYKGLPADIKYSSGRNRVKLYWTPSPDQTVTKYIVYWNDKRDSIVTPANSNHSVPMEIWINGLQEYSYTFIVQSIDDKGNRSIPREVNNVKVCGPLYNASLQNRPYDAVDPYKINNDYSVTINFRKADTVNVGTVITYTNTSDNVIKRTLDSSQYSMTIPDFKYGTKIVFQSSYIPSSGAIDTFKTAAVDTFPYIYRIAECDKSKFARHDLLQDVGTCCGDGWGITKLWDGVRSTKDIWSNNVYHSGGGYGPGITFSFDMGAIYSNLFELEEIGRDCCHNPTEFEVWGSATDNVPDMRGNNSSWETEMISRGWTKLITAKRSDDGQAPMKFSVIDNPPPVRYIRVRVFKTANMPNENSGCDVNISEFTFWYKK